MRILGADTEPDTDIYGSIHLRDDDPRLGMLEHSLQDGILELAEHLGYLTYHTHDSRRSNPGFPDLVLCHPGRRRTIFAELKSTKGHVTRTQDMWLTGLATAGNNVHLWQPYDWVTGGIERELKGPRI